MSEAGGRYGSCFDGLGCQPAGPGLFGLCQSSICKQLVDLGESCDDEVVICLNPNKCSSFSQTCVAPVPAGGACAANNECERFGFRLDLNPTSCNQGTCAPLADAGETCDDDDDCQLNLACFIAQGDTSGSCVPQ